MSGMLNYTFIIVAISSALLGVVSGVVGCFVVLKKQSLLGDGLSHSALPGIVLAFIIFQNTKYLLVGAFLSAVISNFVIKVITQNSKIKFDSALAIVLSMFFGGGIVLLTYVQKIDISGKSGLDNFIYGQASSMLLRDLITISISGSIILTIVFIIFKEIKMTIFDEIQSSLQGCNVKLINIILDLIFVLTIVIGLQSVGVILMSAIMVAPAVIARSMTQKLENMVIIAGAVGGICGALGTAISANLKGVPTGPMIVVCISVVTLLSIIKQRGK